MDTVCKKRDSPAKSGAVGRFSRLANLDNLFRGIEGEAMAVIRYPAMKNWTVGTSENIASF